MKISFDQDIRKITTHAQGVLSHNNLKWVVAKSLTDLAKAGQSQVKTELPKKFTIRRSWVPNGIRIVSAKRDQLWAAVYSKDSGGDRTFMTPQEGGGDKTPQTADHVAIPTKLVKPRITTLIRQKWKPKSLLAVKVERKASDNRMDVERYQQRHTGVRFLGKDKKETYIVDGLPVLRVKDKRGGGKEWILISRKQGKKTKFRAAWLLAPRARIKPTNFLEDAMRKVVTTNTYNFFYENFRNEIRRKNRI